MSVVTTTAGRIAPDEMVRSLRNEHISIDQAEPPRKCRMVGAKVPVAKAKLPVGSPRSRYLPHVVSHP